MADFILLESGGALLLESLTGGIALEVPPPVSIDAVTTLTGTFSAGATFNAVGGVSNRAWLVFVMHIDPNTSERASVDVTYNSVSLTNLGHYFVNNGSFVWDLCQIDVFRADETFIAGQPTGQFLNIINPGSAVVVQIIELSDVLSFDGVNGSAGTGTTVTDNITTTNEGSQGATYNFPSSAKYAHATTAWISQGGRTTIIDGIARNATDDPSPDGSQTEEADTTHGTGTLRGAVSSRAV